MGWEQDGVAWGARASDWACLQEPLLSASYDELLQDFRVGPGLSLLDIGCGAGGFLARASARGATVLGIDASEALLAIAGERAPTAELRWGDMATLPWADDSVDVVTGVNAFMYGTEDAITEARRVLRPGGRLGMVFWENPRDFAGYFGVIGAYSPPLDEVAAVPVRLADPGVAEGMLSRAGFVVEGRRTISCAVEFLDLESALRGLSSAGPAFAAIQHSGEGVFKGAIEPTITPFLSPRTGLIRMAADFAMVSAAKTA